MTRNEIMQLLQVLSAAYPITKINDPKGTVDAWELAFGGIDANIIFGAARIHMTSSPFFPTVSDIYKRIPLVSMNAVPMDNSIPEKTGGEHMSGCEVCIYDDCDRVHCLWEG